MYLKIKEIKPLIHGILVIKDIKMSTVFRIKICFSKH